MPYNSWVVLLKLVLRCKNSLANRFFLELLTTSLVWMNENDVSIRSEANGHI